MKEIFFSILSTLLLVSICVIIYLWVKNNSLKKKNSSGAISGDNLTLSLTDPLYRTVTAKDPAGHVGDYVGVHDGVKFQIPVITVPYRAVAINGRFLINAGSSSMWVEPTHIERKYVIKPKKIFVKAEKTVSDNNNN